MPRPDIRKLAAALAALLPLAATHAPAQSLAGWTASKEITLNTSSTGAAVSAAVAKFPVFIGLDQDNFPFASAKDDGSDIRFTKPDGSPLPFEIEHWDKPGQTAALWVKADVQGNSASQSIVLHWGNPAAANASDGKAVFSLEDGWVGVWHVGEEGNTAPGGYKDATPNQAHGTGLNLKPESRKPGRAGYASDMVFADNAHIRVTEKPKKDLFHLAKNVTFEAWATCRSLDGTGWQTVMAKGDASWRFMQNEKSKRLEICSDGMSPVCIMSKQEIVFGKWYHFVGVHDEPAVRMYINGKLEVQGNASKPHESTGDWDVGLGTQTQYAYPKSKKSWDGVMDEFRVSKHSKNADWIKLEYENLREDSKFVTVGPTQGVFMRRTLPGHLAPADAGARLSIYDLRGRLLGPAKGHAREARPLLR